ncbi:MAG: hypothetical protein RI958_277 [Actinomycetota bacterium]
MTASASNHEAEARLAVWEHRTSTVVLAAALLPIIVGLAGSRNGWVVWIDIGSWLIFGIDLAVHIRFRASYLRTRLGRFDLVIVVLTAPWYLLPFLGGGNSVSLVRLARLGRVFLATSHSGRLRALVRRLGTAAVWSIVLMGVCASVVYIVEPVSSGYETYGDALWWAMVTFATVGYGDYSPVTSGGRIAAVMLMLGGIALIGSLAGSLGSFFGSSDPTEATDDAVPEPSLGELLDELRFLRAEIAELRSCVDRATDATDATDAEPSSG